MAAMTFGDGPEPYVGLRPYDTADRARFFGRDGESYEVRSLWSGNKLLVLHGAAGVGKTSLLRAGVLPLMASTADVLPVSRLPQRTTTDQLEHNPYEFA